MIPQTILLLQPFRIYLVCIEREASETSGLWKNIWNPILKRNDYKSKGKYYPLYIAFSIFNGKESYHELVGYATLIYHRHIF